MATRSDVPIFFVYGEPSRSLDVGFLHVETVMERKTLHFGHVSPHKHPLMGQITYWFQGGGAYRIEEETWNFSAPAVSFVPSNVVHGFDVDEQSDAIVVSISDDMLKAIVPQVALNLDVPTFLAGQPSDPVWSKLGTLLDMIAEDYRDRGTEDEKVLCGLIGVVLSLMGRIGGRVALPSTSTTVSLGLALRRVIDLHYKEDWPVRAYVNELATTPHLLDKAAREVFGLSVKELLLERRLLEAKRLLMFTVRSVEDIGREIGVEDPAYFTRFFRKRTGEAPAAWRRRHLQETASSTT
ncbi:MULTISPECIES: helix-turn-helix domain-containing protein [unclassified Rhizobium]|uniref:helix-turn-helix domain-containing protein n=1 Tax=unclassified Rhizobium TaxID=2613769 RepID=UPI001A988091|nr:MULTISPECIES: helix-turn-helix domain-containing protein [unclassified Rhizobium]MBX5156323.1 helix-turn-helix domain-containing protein [Rhizobium sp. NZLR8]MBX5162452.1 helix-turn-helix domain-containing protein [Rhizobium sp. NZLR4b]MBX5173987.1 helix-turn-helix domain-containing protein [Rhizobium sp. NZLR1b]MBX5185515.1 helix-turn-helix domain-containing protein [Rhizobium sp. NZLR5]MBX5187306.1 helix-turn-helix domain-containing protein [Rhizobium sp. NZLR3b]